MRAWLHPYEVRAIRRLRREGYSVQAIAALFEPVFPISGVFWLNGQSKRDDGMIFGSCKATQSPVYPIGDAILAVNLAFRPSPSSPGSPPMG